MRSNAMRARTLFSNSESINISVSKSFSSLSSLGLFSTSFLESYTSRDTFKQINKSKINNNFNNGLSPSSVGHFVGEGKQRYFTTSGRRKGGIGSMLDSIVSETPKKEALQYSSGRTKWSRSDIKRASDALAAGLSDSGLKPGDTVVTLLGEDDVDLHMMQFTAAKLGLQLAVLDITNLNASTLGKVLSECEPVMVLYAPFHGETDLTKFLYEVVPELPRHNKNSGIPFRSVKYPQLKRVVHTGFDDITGVENMKFLFLPDLSTDDANHPCTLYQPFFTEKTPLCINLKPDGSKEGVLSHGDVLSKSVWPVVSGVLKKEFIKF